MSKKKKLIGLIIGAVFIIAAAIIATIVIANAQKADNETGKTAEEKIEEIVGIWTLTAIEQDGIEVPVYTSDEEPKQKNTFEFKSDKTGIINSMGTEYPFTYDIDKQQITIEQGIISYELDNNRLKMTADEEIMIYTK